MSKLDDLYGRRCSVCGGYHPPSLASKKKVDESFDAIINDIAERLYNEKISKGEIPRALYEATADQLMQAVFSGLGGSSFSYEDPRNELVTYLRQNIYSFSAAKSLTEMKVFNALLIDENGNLRPFTDFRNEVLAKGFQFNSKYLETEYNSAVACSQMAQTWNEFEDDDIIQISTAGDDRVRPAHAILDGFTAPKSDPVWLRMWPPFDWECRCHAVPGLAKNVKSFKTSQLLKEAKIPEYFQRNTGIDKIIYKDDGTYYLNSFKKEKQLTAENNYGMPSVKRVYANKNYPEAEKLKTKAEANNWWAEKAGELRGHFDVKDALGNTVRFDNDTRKHILEDNRDNRHTIVSNVEDITTDPDEIWSIREKGKLTTTYIKYYDDYPYAVQVDGTRAYTAFSYEKNDKMNEQSLIQDRRGILLFRKN